MYQPLHIALIQSRTWRPWDGVWHSGNVSPNLRHTPNETARGFSRILGSVPVDFSADPDLPLVTNLTFGRRFAGDAQRGGSEAPPYVIKV